MWQQFLGEKVRKGMVLFTLEYSLLYTRYGHGPEQPGAADPAPGGEKTSDFQRSLPAPVILWWRIGGSLLWLEDALPTAWNILILITDSNSRCTTKINTVTVGSFPSAVLTRCKYLSSFSRVLMRHPGKGFQDTISFEVSGEGS